MKYIYIHTYIDTQYAICLCTYRQGPGGEGRGGGFPKCHPLEIVQINRETENKKQKTQTNNDLCCITIVIFTKKWKLSYGRYTHSGIRVWHQIRTSDKFEKMLLPPINNSPESKVDFPEKVLVVIWRLILSAWHIKRIFMILSGLSNIQKGAFIKQAIKQGSIKGNYIEPLFPWPWDAPLGCRGFRGGI